MFLFIIVLVLFLISAVILFYKLRPWPTDNVKCLVGKTALITGANSGIGYHLALLFASRGCRVIIADKDNAEETRKKIIQLTQNVNIVIKHLNLASFQSVRAFADDIIKTESQLDVLVNNAGVGSSSQEHTNDGLNLTMQVNYFGPFLLTHLLVGLLKKSARSKIIFASSITSYGHNLTINNLNMPNNHEPTVWDFLSIYSNTKCLNVIAAKCFAEKLRKYGITSNSADPGLVTTSFFEKSYENGVEIKPAILRYFVIYFFGFLKSMFGIHPYLGAHTAFYIATTNDMEEVTGENFMSCRPFFGPRIANDRKFCQEIWNLSESYVKLAPHEKL